MADGDRAGTLQPDGLVGVRAATADADGTGRPLRWVRQGAFTLAFSAHVAVREGADTWLGTVVISADRLLEGPGIDEAAGWPEVFRIVTDEEWPQGPITDGRRLLDSLALAPEFLRRPD